MLSRFIAISLTAIGLPAIASANGGERTPSAYYQVGSIDYIGYDEIGADGLPVCGPCAEKQAAATKAQKEIEARRKRARAYMARMQGQPVPDDLLEPAAAPAEDFDPAAGAGRWRCLGRGIGRNRPRFSRPQTQLEIK